MAKEIKAQRYRVWFEAETATVHFEGSMRLSTRDYLPISELLEEAADAALDTIALNLRALEFLNSSGINTIYKFTIGLRKRGGMALTVIGSRDIGWQMRSLANIPRFLPGADLQLS